MARYLMKSQKFILYYLTFRQISGLLVNVEGRIYRHSIRLDETIRMSYGTAFHDHWMARYLTKRQMAQYRKCKKCRFLTFHQISGHPVITEGRIYRHSIRLDETIRMSYSTAFYDHCITIC